MTPRTAWRLTTGGGAGMATAVVGLLVLACVFLAVAGPREGLALRTHALQQSLNTQQPVQRTIYAAIDDSDLDALLNPLGENPPVTSTVDLEFVQQELRGNLSGLGLPLTPAATSWYGMTTPLETTAGYPAAAAPAGVAPQLELAYRSQLSRYVTLVSGTMPATATQGPDGTVLQIAVTTGTAATLHLHPGSRLSDGPGTSVVVTGIVRATGAASAPFWAADPVIRSPVQQVTSPPAELPYWTGAGFVAAGELKVLQRGANISTTVVYWDFPLNLTGLTAGGAQALSNKLAQAISMAGNIGSNDGDSALSSSPILILESVSQVLTAFIAQDAAAGVVLSLLSVSLAAVGIMVILACAQLVAEQRRTEFALRRSRGAARWQIGALALGGMAAVVIPAAVAGTALAVVLTLGYADPLTWWLAGWTALIALAAVPVAAVISHRVLELPGARLKAPARRAALRRLTAEAMLILLAVGGLVLLRQQGASQGGGSLYTSLAPVLVAVPAAIVAVRAYPVLLGGLLRVSRRRPGIAAFVGFSRAVQNVPRATLPAFTLVLALAVVAFGAMVRSTVHDTDVSVSWQRTGADAVIDRTNSGSRLTPAVQRAIATVPGVRHATAITVVYDSYHGKPFALVGVNPAQYDALVADTPAGAFPLADLTSGQGPGVPALASPGFAAQLGGTSGTLNTTLGAVTIHVTATVASVPGVQAGTAVFVVPASALPGDQPPTQELVTGPGLDSHGLRQIVAKMPGATLTLRSAVLAALTGEPSSHSAYLAITVGSVAAAALVVLLLLVTVILAASDGATILSRLRVMGLRHAQARWLEIAQMLPQVTVSAAGGLVCAYVLAPLIGPSIDLSAFTGAGAAVPVRVQPLLLLIAAGGLLLLAMLTVTLQNVITARRETP